MEPLTAFAEQVLRTIREHGLLSAGERVVVAVSGGPDSMALLDVLVELREPLGLSLWVAHLNHGLRGAAADADAEFVAARAAALGLPATIGRADVAAERRRRGGSVEQAARRVRYEFLSRVAAEAGARKVAVGHTADDQAETILEGLLRGRELKALAGMPVSRPLARIPHERRTDEGKEACHPERSERPFKGADCPYGARPVAADRPSERSFASSAGADLAQDDKMGGAARGPAGERRGLAATRCQMAADVWVVRPLLERTRAEVMAYLAERGVGFRQDESNEDVAFERNWIRHEVLPRLEERSGGGVREALLGLVGRARELAELVDAEGRRLLCGEAPATERRLAVEALARRPSLVRRAAVRQAFALVAGTEEVGWRAVDAVEGLLAGGSGREVRLPGGVVARRSYGEIILLREGGSPRPAVEKVLRVPGRVEAPEVGLWVEAETDNAECRMTNDEWKRGQGKKGKGGGWEEVVDLDRVGTELVVRTRRPGDRFEPLGLGAAKKLKDFLVDVRVPRDARERTLVVLGRPGIVWVVGRRLDERAKVTPATRRVARLRAGPLKPEEARR